MEEHVCVTQNTSTPTAQIKKTRPLLPWKHEALQRPIKDEKRIQGECAYRFGPLDFIHILIVPDSAVTSYERYIHIIFIVAYTYQGLHLI